MDCLHKFLFDGVPVRGMLVRLGASWRELLSRRVSRDDGGHAFAPPVRALLGEMVAAGCLMQGNLKFNGALILQASGDGPVRLLVAETQADLSYRATAKVVGEVPADAGLQLMLNLHGHGRCLITLDPRDRLPGQQPYQGVVSLERQMAPGRPKPAGPPRGAANEVSVGANESPDHRHDPLHRFSNVIEHYMLQSEQLDTKLVLAADDNGAAGLLIQRLPMTRADDPAAAAVPAAPAAWPREDEPLGGNEDFNRLALLAATLTPQELLTLDPEQVLHRLFWQEPLRRFEPLTPRFACSCSRQRVLAMLEGLGSDEVDSIIAERGQVEVGCDFCGVQYHFDPVDVGELFTPGRERPPGSPAMQ